MRFLLIRRILLILLALIHLCEGQAVKVEERFRRTPDLFIGQGDEKQIPQKESLMALDDFLRETVDKGTLTKWFGKPTLLSVDSDSGLPLLPKDYVTTHHSQHLLARQDSGGMMGSHARESYFYPIKGTDLGIFFQRWQSPNSGEDKLDPFYKPPQWFGSGSFTTKWPQDKLGFYKNYPAGQLDKWEDEQATAVLKALWRHLAADLQG